MAKVQFQVDGLDSNTASIFNDDVTFDGNVDAASISIDGTDIFEAIPPGPTYSTSAPQNPTVGQVWIDSDSSVTEYDMSTYATLESPTFTGTVVLPNSTVTNSMLAGSIENSKLQNSTITINGSAISLGGSTTINALPSQTNNGGKYLTTDGTTASWASVTTDPTADIFMLMGA